MIDDGDGSEDADEDAGNDDDVAPAPASIGTDVPLSYFGAHWPFAPARAVMC